MRRRSITAAAAMDGAGVTLSTACIIHCLVFPLALALLPSWSEALSLPEEFHLIMVMIAVPLSSYVLLRARHAKEGRRLRLGLGFAGLALMVAALNVEGEAIETALTTFGAALVATSHILNWRGRARTCSTV